MVQILADLAQRWVIAFLDLPVVIFRILCVLAFPKVVGYGLILSPKILRVIVRSELLRIFVRVGDLLV